MNSMKNQEIKYILAIASSSSVSDAAKKLYISQPALSKYLRQREKEIGSSLFEKQNGKLIPTPAGSIYLHYAKEIADMEEQCNRELLQYFSKDKSNLIFGIPSSRAADLEPMIHSLKEANPDYCFTMVPDHSRAVFEQVKNGIIDLAITNEYEEDPVGIPLVREEIAFWIPKTLQKRFHLHNHVLPSLECLKEGCFFLSSSDNLYGWVADRIFTQESFHPLHVKKMNNSLLAGALAAEHGGISLHLKPSDPFDSLNNDLFTLQDHHYYNNLCLYLVSRQAQRLDTEHLLKL